VTETDTAVAISQPLIISLAHLSILRLSKSIFGTRLLWSRCDADSTEREASCHVARRRRVWSGDWQITRWLISQTSRAWSVRTDRLPARITQSRGDSASALRSLQPKPYHWAPSSHCVHRHAL